MPQFPTDSNNRRLHNRRLLFFTSFKGKKDRHTTRRLLLFAVIGGMIRVAEGITDFKHDKENLS
jgi:hypothetical protein